MKLNVMSAEQCALPAKKYDAILLASFGGPEGQEDVLPFLRNVTRGRGIPDERLEEVAHHYRVHAGVSPINEQNRQLKACLEKECAARGINLPILWGNRNWDPYFADVFKAAYERGYKNILTIVTSAYSSYSGCRQYREDFAQALEKTGLTGKLHIDKIRQYFDHPGFIDPFIEGIEDAISRMRHQLEKEHRKKLFHVMFVTHSIPQADADVSGPGAPLKGPDDSAGPGAYVLQHEAVMEVIMASIKTSAREDILLHHSLVYQSRSGHPSTPWLEPDINDAIADLEDVNALIVVPIGFVSDHMEVIWDLDHEAQQSAQKKDVLFERVATPGIHEKFVAGIVDLLSQRCEETSNTQNKSSLISQLGPWFDECSPSCCVNQRQLQPVTNECTSCEKLG